MDAKHVAERAYDQLRRDAFRLAQAYCIEKFEKDFVDDQYILKGIEPIARQFWSAVKGVRDEDTYLRKAERLRKQETGRILDRLSPAERIALREHFTQGAE